MYNGTVVLSEKSGRGNLVHPVKIKIGIGIEPIDTDSDTDPDFDYINEPGYFLE